MVKWKAIEVQARVILPSIIPHSLLCPGEYRQLEEGDLGTGGNLQVDLADPAFWFRRISVFTLLPQIKDI